jgi:hypothetical protein
MRSYDLGGLNRTMTDDAPPARCDEVFPLGHGRLRIWNEPAIRSWWSFTWLPDDCSGGNGFTLSSETITMPTSGGAAAILKWAKQQPWAKP